MFCQHGWVGFSDRRGGGGCGEQSWARDNTVATMKPSVLTTKMLLIAIFLYLVWLPHLNRPNIFSIFFLSLRLYYCTYVVPLSMSRSYKLSRAQVCVGGGGVTRVEDLVVVELLEAGGPVLVNPQGHPSNTFLKQKVYRLWFSHKVLTGQNTVLKL